jgi:pilus assembly protein CpaB
MRTLRCIARIGIFVLVAFTAGVSLTVLFKAQAYINQQAELYMIHNNELDAPQTTTVTRFIDAISGPLQSGSEPAPSTAGEAPQTADTPQRSNSVEFRDVAAIPPNARDSFEAKPAHTSIPPEPRVTPYAMLAKGKNALPIHVNNAESVMGLSLPNVWVDVALTSQPKSNSVFSDIVVQNARVLAIDNLFDGGNSEQPAARSVMLEVDLVSAQKLLVASEVGTLSLILRRADDIRLRGARRVSISDLTEVETASEQDNARFTSVRVNRFGAKSSVYSVLRE